MRPGPPSLRRWTPATGTSTQPRPTANERQVGEALANASVPRADVIVETKIWISDYGYDETLHGFDKSAGKLGVDQIDLLINPSTATAGCRTWWRAPCPGKRPTGATAAAPRRTSTAGT
jgi:hypothetical protein